MDIAPRRRPCPPWYRLGPWRTGGRARRTGEHGFHTLVLSAFPFDAAGLALHIRSGFRTVGIDEEQGPRDGRGVDTIVRETLLR